MCCVCECDLVALHSNVSVPLDVVAAGEQHQQQQQCDARVCVDSVLCCVLCVVILS